MRNKSVLKAIAAMGIALMFTVPAFTSDMAEAESLRKRCEKEGKAFEVCVANFGDESEKKAFLDSVKKLKLAKLRITQSKYKEAIDLYNDYLKLQRKTYDSLAKKYLDRTKKINDEIAEVFVENIDDPRVDKYFKMAYRHYNDAKSGGSSGNPVLVIEACRRSKEYSIGVYGLLGKPIPDMYKTDVADNAGRIAGK
ncbi:MAG: hypothetical protein JW807_08520 [Spirochaetes bacterium]|nr:hypothetical protein [Spirochaetota bacterium]